MQLPGSQRLELANVSQNDNSNSALFLFASTARAQQGYEFEVYGIDVPAKSARQLEVHLNFVPAGTQDVDNAQGRATNRAVRSSIGLGTGLSSWLEATLYTVTYARNGAGVQYVGNRGRLIAVAPERWKLPFNAGLSQEIGYARPGFAESRWVYELSPIIGKEMGRVSLLFNPVFSSAGWIDARGRGNWSRELDLATP